MLIARKKTKTFFGTRTRGVSFIEVIIVMSVSLFIVTLALASFSSERERTALRDAEATVLHAFERARSRAMSGVGESDHGVHVEADAIVSFEGETYTGDGTRITLPPGISTDHTNTDVVFERLIGRTTADVSVLLSQANGTSTTVIVTEEGYIGEE